MTTTIDLDMIFDRNFTKAVKEYPANAIASSLGVALAWTLKEARAANRDCSEAQDRAYAYIWDEVEYRLAPYRQLFDGEEA